MYTTIIDRVLRNIIYVLHLSHAGDFHGSCESPGCKILTFDFLFAALV